MCMVMRWKKNGFLMMCRQISFLCSTVTLIKRLASRLSFFSMSTSVSKKSCLAPEGVGCPLESYSCQVCPYWGLK